MTYRSTPRGLGQNSFPLSKANIALINFFSLAIHVICPRLEACYGRGRRRPQPTAVAHPPAHLQHVQAAFGVSPFPGTSQGKFPPALCLLGHLCSLPRELPGGLSARFAACFVEGVNALEHIVHSEATGLMLPGRKSPYVQHWTHQEKISEESGANALLRAAIHCFLHQLLHLLCSADVEVGQSVMKRKNSNTDPAKAWACNCELRSECQNAGGSTASLLLCQTPSERRGPAVGSSSVLQYLSRNTTLRTAKAAPHWLWGVADVRCILPHLRGGLLPGFAELFFSFQRDFRGMIINCKITTGSFSAFPD